MKFIRKCITFIVLLCAVFAFYTFHNEIHSRTHYNDTSVEIEVKPGQSIAELSAKLEEDGIIRYAWLFEKYLSFKGVDTKVQSGLYTIEPPVTLSKIVDALAQAQQTVREKELTLLPGWDTADIATYLEKEGIASASEVLAMIGKPAYNYALAGEPAPTLGFESFLFEDKPNHISYDGYLAPDTVRVFASSSLETVLQKFIDVREKQIEEFLPEIQRQGRTIHEVLTLASVIQREVRGFEDKKMVADLFLRRLEAGIGLEADSTIHYLTQKKGQSVFTTRADRQIDSLWNTYKYRGLPLGPISLPSKEAIEAVLYPTKNDYWYFLTTLDSGEVIYARSLNEHNNNRNTYLR